MRQQDDRLRRAAAALPLPAAALHVAVLLVPAAPVLALAADEPATLRWTLALRARHELGRHGDGGSGGRRQRAAVDDGGG